MTMIRLALKGFLHYWKISICLCLGVTLASSILTGSLFVGDSVDQTLRNSAAQRIGSVRSALIAGDRFFTSALASKVNQSIKNNTSVAALNVPGTLNTPDKAKRVNRVNVYGIDNDFWKLAGNFNKKITINENNFLAIGSTLAEQKQLQIGDQVIIKVEMPGHVSRDAPLSGESGKLAAISSEITHIVSAESGGSFSLRAEQSSALNVFVPLKALQEKLSKEDRANIILSSSSDNFEKAVQDSWTHRDLELNYASDLKSDINFTTFQSDRVFISEKVESAIMAVDKTAEPILSYLINDIHFNEKSVPYSVGTGIGPQSAKLLGIQVPRKNEVVIHHWLSDDIKKGGLDTRVGDTINISYFSVINTREFTTVGDQLDENGLEDQSDKRELEIKSIIPSDNPGLRIKWVPEFPGLKTAKTLSSWESGLPLNTKNIRPQDEEYWDKYRATPKMFLPIDLAKTYWGNRFGKTTSILVSQLNSENFHDLISPILKVTDLGMQIRQPHKEAEQSVSNALDFGSLFASLSGFLILAALLLSLMLCLFAVESRTTQLGALGAIGFTQKKLRNLLLIEFLISVFLGSLLGAAGGYLYTKVTLMALSSIWIDAAAGVQFVFEAKSDSLIYGTLGIFVFALIVIRLSVNKITSQSPRELLASSHGIGLITNAKGERKRRTNFLKKIVIIISFTLGACCVALGYGSEGEKLAGSFFGAGFFFLLGFIQVFSSYLKGLSIFDLNKKNSLHSIARRNAARRVGRSLSVAATVASGVFLIISVNAFRLSSSTNSKNNESGTGGYEFFAKSTLPIYEDLNDVNERDNFGFEEYTTNDIKFVPFRVIKDGEEASCQNLNHAIKPRVLGVKTEPLINDQAFQFSSVLTDPNDSDPQKKSNWGLLDKESSQNIVPVIGDKASVMWAMKKKLGDLIDYTDENGQPLKLQVAGLLENSTLQGNLVMSEANFIKYFPSTSGYQMFLVNTGEVNKIIESEMIGNVTKALEQRGMEFVSSHARLAEYTRVQNTYISIFSVLGGLGLLLGTLGVGMLIARSVIERRSELSIMTALGFHRSNLTRMLISEHLFLVGFGIISGILASIIAISPNISGKGAQFPIDFLFGIVLLISIGSITFCIISARVSLNGNLIEGIRSE
ncbi:MAG: ABC transporter permease [Verrucomicrobiota bacterium]|nr:ABC transporter permease [Verrucomicrobiota bacterium]